jgi:hypothetical protein
MKLSLLCAVFLLVSVHKTGANQTRFVSLIVTVGDLCLMEMSFTVTIIMIGMRMRAILSRPSFLQG